jgi:hypothetical protein
MSSLPLPNRGQPVDTAYIYDMAVVINELAQQLSLARDNNSVIDTRSGGKQPSKTSALSILAGVVKIANDSNVTATNTKPFTYMFDKSFKYSPVVTATVVNDTGTTAGENVSVVITDVSKSSVTGLVRFNSSGTVSTSVNLIIIGIPN